MSSRRFVRLVSFQTITSERFVPFCVRNCSRSSSRRTKGIKRRSHAWFSQNESCGSSDQSVWRWIRRNWFLVGSEGSLCSNWEVKMETCSPAPPGAPGADVGWFPIFTSWTLRLIGLTRYRKRESSRFFCLFFLHQRQTDLHSFRFGFCSFQQKHQTCFCLQHVGLPMFSVKKTPKRIYQMTHGVLNLPRNFLLDWTFGHSLISCHVEHHLFPFLSDNMCLKVELLGFT